MKRTSPRSLTFVVLAIAIAMLNPPLVLLWPSNSDTPQKEANQDKPGKKDPPQDKSRQLTHDSKAKEAITTNDNPLGAQSFALLVGISYYKNLPQKAQLQFADEDAKALREFLVSPKGGFNPDNVTLLVNEQATYQEISRALEQLQNRAGPRDLAFVFFAGHGLVNRSNQAFLLTHDSQPEQLFPTSLEMDRFNSVLKNMRARSTVIITDACHSGAIGDLINQSDSPEMVKSVSAKSFADPSGRIDQSSFILSAASPMQSSWEMKSLRHGLFTHHLLGGLNGKADRNADNLVTSKELYDYVATHVQRDSEQEGRSQVPEFNPQYDPSIPMAYLDEAGYKLYQEWFDSVPFITRYTALYEDALKENRLTKPERASAWDYYDYLKRDLRVPLERVKQMEGELLAKLNTSAMSVIAQAPTDPGLWQEASSWLEKANQLSPDKLLRPKQTFCSAMAAYYSGENGRAERECDAAINMLEESNLKDPILYFRIGQFYKKTERWEKARRSFKAAIVEDPKVDWIGEYAEVLIQINDLAEAEAQLRQAQSLNPSYTYGLRLLAEVLLRSDREEKFAEAVAIAEQARLIKPDDIEIEDVYGWALVKAGRPSRAVAPLRKVAQARFSENRKRDLSLLRLSRAYAESGDLDRSISALREAEQRGSRDAGIFDELSRRLEERGDLKGATEAAEKAVALVQTNAQETAKRLHRLAEHFERSGNLSQAALKYKDAARLYADIRVNTSLNNHANVLSYRAGRPQDAGPLPKRPVLGRRRVLNTGELLIVPGGREALERLTGVRIEASDEGDALATIFQACLRDSTMRARLIYFYDKYPDLAKKIESKGLRQNERFELSAAGKPLSEVAAQALAFFGIKEKNGRREINRKEFELKKEILEAIGGDPQRLEQGEATVIVLKNNDFSVTLGMQQWVRRIKDGMGAQPSELLLRFLRDQQAMQLYVGLSMLPEEGAEWVVVNATSRENADDLPGAIYFAAPYLRFTQEGSLYIPGQRQGELNWQRLVGVSTLQEALRVLFKREHQRALYLFAALSASGEIGDLIAGSPLFNHFYKSMKDSQIHADREPFDLIDFLTLFQTEGGKPRLSNVIESWSGAGRAETDPLAVILSKLDKVPAGKQVPVAKQMAALNQIESLRPDWVSDRERIELITKQISSGREAMLELALDLNMDWKQLESYIGQIARLESISTLASRSSATRAFQAAFELLRVAARRGLGQARVEEVANRLLELDPGAEGYAFDLASILKGFLGLEASSGGQQAEERLIALVSGDTKFAMLKRNAQAARGSKNVSDGITLYQFDGSKSNQERITRALQSLNHTRFRAVINAINMLKVLETSSSDATAIQQLKAVLGEFVEPEAPPAPKKGKAKQQVVREPTLKEVADQLAAPITPGLIADLRHRIAPFVGEALLGALYASLLNPLPDQSAAYADLARRHDVDAAPWGSARFDEPAKTVRGNASRLSQALGEIHARSADFGDRPSALSLLFTTTVLNSYEMIDQRLVTNRAQEYVARSLDLGEDVLGLYLLGEQTARSTVNQLDEILSLRRADMIRGWLDQGESNKAISSLSLSELYYIGQRYFKLRIESDNLSNLINEPGALGALARVFDKAQTSAQTRDIPEQLKREIRQFGTITLTRTNLMRLELAELEPYEQAIAVEDNRRLAERMQDFKLALARACYRQGHPASLALSPLLARSVVQQKLIHLGKLTGRMPPEQDWQGFLSVIQTYDEASFTAFVQSLTESSYTRPVPETRWDDAEENAAPAGTRLN
jgi:Flp pilus assembly protein TadD